MYVWINQNTLVLDLRKLYTSCLVTALWKAAKVFKLEIDFGNLGDERKSV